MVLNGAEVWGCGRQFECSCMVFLGVGRLHPEVALQIEMEMLPLKWEAKTRCMEFWLKVLRMWDSRLIRLVVLEAME